MYPSEFTSHQAHCPLAMTNVFKIRHGKETNVYRTDTPADKKALLSQFRQVAEELADKRRKEREGEHERRKSMWTGADVRTWVPFNLPQINPSRYSGPLWLSTPTAYHL